MGSRDHFLRIEAVLDGPAAPYAGDRGSRVDENSVHVKEQSGAVDLGHLRAIVA